MKKFISILLTLTICLCLASCSLMSGKTTNYEKINSENLPDEQAEIVALYNYCLENSDTLKRTEYQRALMYCNAKLINKDINICEFFPDINDVVGIDDTNEADSSLASLDEAQVKSAALIEKSESTATYKIELTDAVSDQTVKSGQGGYWDILEFQEISDLIVTSTAQIGVEGVEVGDEMVINLTEGTLQVVIDLDSKK
ncbi:MAG: hypothetical protein NC397_00085 [Clostridium sp.]|nr:hypothetical protein [Clostridium sp.]